MLVLLMKVMRLFIAIDFDEHKQYFNKIQKTVGLEEESLLDMFHMTLLFLGDQTIEGAQSIKKSLRTLQARPFYLTFDHMGLFSVKRRKDIFWVGVKDDSSIRFLRKKIISSLEDVPLKLTKRFIPHVTIARRNRKSTDNSFHASRLDVAEKTVRINSIKLVQSTLTSKGPIYTVLEEFFFAEKKK